MDKKLSKLCKCEGCQYEIEECYNYQRMGENTGLEFWGGHLFFYAIDAKTGKFIVPIYQWGGKNDFTTILSFL